MENKPPELGLFFSLIFQYGLVTANSKVPSLSRNNANSFSSVVLAAPSVDDSLTTSRMARSSVSRTLAVSPCSLSSWRKRFSTCRDSLRKYTVGMPPSSILSITVAKISEMVFTRPGIALSGQIL